MTSNLSKTPDPLNDLFCGIYMKDTEYLKGFFDTHIHFNLRDLKYLKCNDSIIDALLDNFDLKTADLLLNKGLAVPDNSRFLNVPVYKNNIDSLQ